MKLVRMRAISGKLGIPISTIQKWVEKTPHLSVVKNDPLYGPCHWIKLDRFAEFHGIQLHDVFLLLGSSRLVKAVELAAVAGISRKTVANWCRFRPKFAVRFGRIYYVDLNRFCPDEDEAETLYQRIIVRRSGQMPSEE